MSISDSVGDMVGKTNETIKRDANRLDGDVDQAAERVADRADDPAGQKFSDNKGASAKGRSASSKPAKRPVDKFGNQK